MNRKRLRVYPRAKSSFAVEYKADSVASEAQSANFGGGGLFIGAAQQLSPGTELSLLFRPAKHLPLIAAKARVSYQIPDQGFGVEFIEVDSEHQQMLLRLIHHRGAEKRRFPRVPLVTQIVTDVCTAIAFSRDISLGGMIIETKEPLPVGAEFEVRFHLEGDDPILVAQAEVVYVVLKLAMGVHFIDLAPDNAKRIEAFVTKSAAMPDPSAEGEASI